MNRVRETKGGYQVLTVPHRKYDVSFEFLLGSWTDEGLLGFKVYEYDNYADAECEALRGPDVNWEQLHDFHKDQYGLFGSIITDVLDYSEVTVNMYPHLMKPEQIKHTMMNRVLKAQKTMALIDGGEHPDHVDTGFRLAYDMNDIITYVVVNPWSANLAQVEQFLAKESRLNIFKSHSTNGITHLVGRTDIGTTYSIILCPAVMYHFMLWKEEHASSVSSARMGNELRKAVRAQKAVDRTEPIA